MIKYSSMRSDEDAYDCIVLGGGISGVSFAHKLKHAGQRVLIVDENASLGGQIRTYQSKTHPDFCCGLGAHTCYNSYTHLLSMVRESGAEDIIQEIENYSYVVYTEGKIRSIFSQLNKFELLLHCRKMFFSKKKGMTVREYFEPLVGKSNYASFFSKAFRAVICQNADKYPAELFLKRRAERYKEIPRKYTFKGGMASLTETIVDKDGIDLHLNIHISSIAKNGKLFTVKTSEGKCFSAHNIALAIDPKGASELLKDIERPISELLAAIPISELESVCVIVKKESVSSIKNIAGILPSSDEFYSVVSRDTLSHPSLRAFTFHFERGKHDKEKQLSIACKVLEIEPEQVLETSSMSHLLPSLGLEHLSLDTAIARNRQNDNVYLLGNYYYGLSLEDCVHRSSTEFERYKSSLK
ncbi:FAD-dependent oxidoreductase [Bacteroidales bacterium]|nr:FAD-dependent oxidoreductase [Bacteroidales bacterium]